MDGNKLETIRKRIAKTGEALKRNNMEFYTVEKASDVPELVKSLIKKGDTIGTGGSMTLKETGVMDLLRSGDYNFLDREAVPKEEIPSIYRKCFSADVYMCSSNAITENGELYNVDGNSNRVAAICYGPESVIIVAGYNKIVTDIEEASVRVKKLAAPANTMRLDCDTYCREKGECAAFVGGNKHICDGCGGNDRICCNFVISAKQRHKNRIKVIIVEEELGY